MREHLPGAEIILSTWKGADVSDLSFDVLSENDDPGAVPIFPKDDPRRALNNVNRQIVSAKSGLRLATRSFAIKMRTDTTLTGTRFLSYFRRYTARCDSWKILRERVVTSTVYFAQYFQLSHRAV